MTVDTWQQQLKTMAKAAVEEAGGDWTDAKKRLQKQFDNDPALLQSLLKAVVEWAIDDLVDWAGRMPRAGFWDRAYEDSGETQTSGRKTAGTLGVAARNLLNYPLRNGLMLGEATRPDLQLEEQSFRTQAATMNIRATWFGLIAKRLKSDTVKVKKVLDHNALVKLRDEALKAAA